jgi:hypothetical protein
LLEIVAALLLLREKLPHQQAQEKFQECELKTLLHPK